MAEVTHSPGWAAALARRAPTVNAAVDRARVNGADVAALRTALIEVGPLFDTLRPAFGTAEDRWAEQLAVSTIDLVATQQFHEQSWPYWALREVFPRLTPAFTVAGPAVLQDLLVAASTLRGNADLAAFGGRLTAGVAAWPDRDSLTREAVRHLSVLAAWRAGHVRLRKTAHRVAVALPEEAVAATLSLGSAARDTLARNATDPTWWPGVATDRSIGGFRGFGGPWRHPPVVLDGDGLCWRVVADGVLWLVLADAHGDAVLADGPVPADIGPPRATAGPAALVSVPTSHRLRLRRLSTP